VPLSTFAAFGSPKNDPGRKVVTELGKFVVDASLHEKHIVLLERSSLAVFDEYTTARDNDVKFILFVGILNVFASGRIKTDFHRSMAKCVVEPELGWVVRQFRSDLLQGVQPFHDVNLHTYREMVQARSGSAPHSCDTVMTYGIENDCIQGIKRSFSPVHRQAAGEHVKCDTPHE
jgi:hypothetical protein